MIFKTGERQLVVFLSRKTAHVLHTRFAPLLGFVGLLGAKRLIVSRLSWKWRKGSPVKIIGRTYEKGP